MVDSLPKAIQLKLKQGLASWRHWQTTPSLLEAPSLQRPLSGGRSNHSWLVASRGQEFVLRLDGINPQRLGMSRSAEQRAQKQAAAAGLAPQLCWFNPELGIMVSDYLPAQAAPGDRQLELEAIAQLLQDIHRLPPVKFRLQPLARAQRYQAILGVERAGQLDREFVQACQSLSVSAAELRLCHNDLLAANRIWSGNRPLALDWEYAAMGHPLFELAVICEGDQLNPAESEHLLHSYCRGHAISEQLRDQLQDARCVYRTLSGLWEQCTRL
jgi:aminoglycoside phosphotransferase (APT) family kinase protein